MDIGDIEMLEMLGMQAEKTPEGNLCLEIQPKPKNIMVTLTVLALVIFSFFASKTQ